MADRCAEYRPRLGALADRELSPAEAARVEEHVSDCPPCRGELEATRALSRRLGGLSMPRAAGRFRPERPSPRGWRYLPATAAAALLVALLFLAVPGPIPELVALTARLHDDYLEGRVSPRDLGLRFSLPGADYVGSCACPPELSPASPFIVYRHQGRALSLLLSASPPGPLPASARRNHEGRPYYFFRAGRNRAIVRRSGDISHVWISRFDEKTMLRAILATPEGSRLFSDRPATLEALACRACCDFLESRARAVDIVNIERVVTPEGSGVDLHQVIEALREAGYRPLKKP